MLVYTNAILRERPIEGLKVSGRTYVWKRKAFQELRPAA